jgi:hypothetical protein
MAGNASVIQPTFLAGKNSSVLVTIGGTTPVITPIPISGFSPSEKIASFDATNAEGQGYEDVEAGTRSCTFTFDAKWKRATGSPLASTGAPAIRLGGIYFFQLNTQQLTAGSPNTYEGWSGNALVTGIDSKIDIKGETMWTGTAQFKGVYNSPDYPTAIADAAASPPVGDFALGAAGSA